LLARYLALSVLEIWNQSILSVSSKLVDDIVYEVDAKMVTIKEGDVDIGK